MKKRIRYEYFSLLLMTLFLVACGKQNPLDLFLANVDEPKLAGLLNHGYTDYVPSSFTNVFLSFHLRKTVQGGSFPYSLFLIGNDSKESLADSGVILNAGSSGYGSFKVQRREGTYHLSVSAGDKHFADKIFRVIGSESATSEAAVRAADAVWADYENHHSKKSDWKKIGNEYIYRDGVVWKAYVEFEKALSMGCTDPEVYYRTARVLQLIWPDKTSDKIGGYLERAAKSMAPGDEYWFFAWKRLGDWNARRSEKYARLEQTKICKEARVQAVACYQKALLYKNGNLVSASDLSSVEKEIARLTLLIKNRRVILG